MRLVAPAVSLLRRKSRDDTDLNRELQSLLSTVTNCVDRKELEHLLGLPDYVMSGELHGQTTPDALNNGPIWLNAILLDV